FIEPESSTALRFSPAQPTALRVWEPTPVDQIYLAFDVSQPVDQPQDLRGREEEVTRLLSGVLHRRNHGIVSGPRGSGKTSLVRVFGQYADREGIVVLYSACDGGTTFGELLRGYLEQIPSSMIDADEIDLFDQRVLSFGVDSSPHQATSLFAQVKYSRIVIVLDEFDRVRDAVLHWKMASLLKLISDARLPVRFVLVGGNTAFADVVREHPSLMRHITRVSTNPLSRAAILELLDSCAQRCNVRFSSEAKRLIYEIACGSPYHARLFGMHSALAAARDGSNEVIPHNVETGLAEAFDEWAALNQEDAGTFRAICEGSHGDPGPIVAFVKRFANAPEDQQTGDESSSDSKSLQDGEDRMIPAFGSALTLDGDDVGFRDATAPQFLIALDAVSRRAPANAPGATASA
ncbi:MAG TPA: ATP-binding protein, partial [Sphingomicrobium sp.]